jgi:PAS domain S-box-containing protein
MSRVAIWAVFVLSGFDLLERLLNAFFLVNFGKNWHDMKIETALCLIISATALLYIRDDKSQGWKRRSSLFLGLFVCMVGLLNVGMHVMEVSGGPWTPANNALFNGFHFFSSRMSIITAALFSLYGCVLVFLSSGHRRLAEISHIILLPVTMISHLVIVGYLFKIPALHSWLKVSSSLNTNIAFFCLCVAAFSIRPDTWFMSVFTNQNAGAMMARRLLPCLLILPLTIGWLRLKGERLGFFGSEVGVAIVVVTYTVSFLWLVWLTARSINRTDFLRHKAEETLRESENMLRSAQEIAHLGSWELDSATNTLKWSEEIYRIFGLTPGEIKATYKSFLDAVHPDDRALVDAAYSGSVRAGKKMFEIEHRIVKKHSGEEIFVHQKCEHFRDNSGNIVRSIGMVHDITERRRQQEAYRVHARLLQYSVKHSLDDLLEETLNETEKLTGSCISFFHFVDSDQKSLTLQNWSTQTKRTFCKAEGKGSHYDLSRAGVWVDCVYKRKPVIHNDYATLPHKKGLPQGHAQVIRELLIPVFNGDTITAILGVGNKKTDYDESDVKVVTLMADLVWTITERKRAEEGLILAKNQLELRVLEKTSALKKTMSILEAERKRFNDVLEKLPVCVALLTPEHKVPFANRFFIERFGEANGQRCFEYLFNRIKPCEICETFKPFATHAPHNWEWTGPDNRIYDMFDFPFVDVDGSPLIMEMGIDITDRKKAEAALIEANEMKLLGQLTSGVAHEVRNPLNGIMAIMGALSKELSDSVRFEPYMQHMRNQVTRLTTLMEDLLALGRPLREENMREVSLVSIVETAVGTWRETMQTSTPIVKIDNPDNPEQCLIRADATNMTQMIINLLENAYHHSPKDAEIMCRVHGKVTNTVILCIKDRGTGIAQEILPRIFEPFFTMRKGGTGLGLSIVRHIVEIHQGSIFAYNNTDGPGATFEVVLPLFTKP